MYILYLTDVTLEEVNEGSISGIVTDGTNPLEGVTVSIQGHDLQQTTDESGAYTFKELEIGSYTLRFDKMGYRPAEQTGITVEMGETTTVNQTMELLPVYSVSGKLVNVQNRPRRPGQALDNRLCRLFDPVGHRRFLLVPAGV